MNQNLERQVEKMEQGFKEVEKLKLALSES